MMRRTERFTTGARCRLAGGIGLVCLTMVGCGSGKLPLYPVTGKVLVDGKPAPGAMVIFCPVTGSEQLMRERPFGITGGDGTFKLTTFLKNDGAPAAAYKILAMWPTNSPAANTQGQGSRSSLGPDRLKGKYFNLDRTTLTATVTEGPNDLPAFELSSR